MLLDRATRTSVPFPGVTVFSQSAVRASQGAPVVQLGGFGN
ncbi:MAG TPA: hypothetical protein VF469_37150 [Kofleriaceae bacterium]